MSKVRENIPFAEGDLEMPVEGDLQAFVVFTQQRADRPHVYAGWVDAADTAMALQFAREHYGQDQECVNIWIFQRGAITDGTGDPGYPSKSGTYRVCHRDQPGDPLIAVEVLEAPDPLAAWGRARTTHDATHGLWVVPTESIASTAPDDLIWRLTDQTYRLARGYSKDVRAKWEKIRARRDIETYERDDLTETF